MSDQPLINIENIKFSNDFIDCNRVRSSAFGRIKCYLVGKNFWGQLNNEFLTQEHYIQGVQKRNRIFVSSIKQNLFV